MYPYGTSDYSEVAAARTEADVPPPPVARTATAKGPTQIAVSWQSGGGDPTGFRIERSTDSAASGFEEIAVLASGTTDYVDSNLSPATRCWYRMRAQYSFGTSEYSGVATARTEAGVTLPPDPATVATALPDAVAFLYSGDNSIQTGVSRGSLDRVYGLQPIPSYHVSALGRPTRVRLARGR